MKKVRRPIEVFNLSFLDVISCGFGAIILLLVLSLALEPATLERMSEDISSQIEQTNAERFTLITQSRELQNKLSEKRARLKEIEEEMGQLLEELKDSQKGGPSSQIDEQARLQDELEVVLQKLTREMKNLLNQQQENASQDDAAIGGIPVDSEYIIFVVDTSGSMLSEWPEVIKKMEQVLRVHPRVKGLQIMNDMGIYMFQQYAGQWIPDTPSRRKEVLKRMRAWKSFSNSSPVEGVTKAVQDFYRKGDKISVYVFGDDFPAGSIDAVLKGIGRSNMKNQQGQTLVRIHTFGFPVLFNNKAALANRTRFAHLMRLLAEQNAGSFVGLTQ